MSKMSTRWGWFLRIAICGTSIFPANWVHAQITTDGTLPNNSIVTPDGSTLNITGGTQAGSNLFHSFKEFSVPTGGTAFFNNAVDIQNIISRVTGGSVSNIDGLIKANGTANLFLINPSGIIFGQNARLDIGGSFLASTASAIKFADGSQFSTTASQTTPLLTVNVPVGLQFGTNAGKILVQGLGSNFTYDYDYDIDKIIRTDNFALQVQPGKTLALVGGDVELEGGNLRAESGRIELGSIASTSLVNLTQTDSGITLGYAGVQNFGDIKLSQKASADASGEGGGSIQVQGRRLSVRDGSSILSITSGSMSGGNFTVNTSELVELIGESADGQLPSSLFFETKGTGNVGSLTINTRQLFMSDGAKVSTNTYGPANGGNLNVNASESVQLTGVSSNNNSSTVLSTQTRKGSTGDGGSLTITTQQLHLSNGGRVSISNYGSGNGGNLNVNASQSVQLIENSAFVKNPYTPCTSFCNNISIFDSGLFAITAESGNAGSITITTRQLLISNSAAIIGYTVGSGNGGSLNVNASESVQLTGRGAVIDDSSVISVAAITGATGNAGSINITTPQFLLSDGALVSVSNRGSGMAGNLSITANSVQINNGEIAAATSRSNGGNIELNVADLLLLKQGSFISATGDELGGIDFGDEDTEVTEVGGDGGNITINAPNGFIVAVPSKNIDITANAYKGKGGRVTINATGIFGIAPLSRQDLERLSPDDLDPGQLPTNDITAVSQTNPSLSGTIELNIPDIDPNTGLINLPTIPVDTQVAQSCTAGGNQAKSSFIITGRGGLPPNPGEPLNTDAVQVDLITLNPTSDRPNSPTVTSKTTTAAPERIVEATGWIINEKGEVVLIANSPTTPHSPWFNQPDCRAS